MQNYIMATSGQMPVDHREKMKQAYAKGGIQAVKEYVSKYVNIEKP